MASLNCTFFFLHLAFNMTCSHKKGALQFLDQICLLYQHEYMHASSAGTGNSEAFMDKVFELANSNGLSSMGLKSALSGLSDEKLKMHLKKVPDYSWL